MRERERNRGREREREKQRKREREREPGKIGFSPALAVLCIVNSVYGTLNHT